MTNVRCLKLQLALNSVEGVEVLRALDGGPLTISDMGLRTGVDVLRLARVTRSLMSYGVLARRADGRYARFDVPARKTAAH